MQNILLNTLIDDYYSSRPNLHIAHSPLCVFFFACSGSGKSTIRSLLITELEATYVCNDEVRELLAMRPDAVQHGIGLKDVVAGAIEKIFSEAENKLVIFDNNIIQYYMHNDSYLNVAKANQRPVFIIGLDTSKSELENRIRKRGLNVYQILSELPGQLQDYQKAKNDIKPDWIINNTANAYEFQGLIAQIGGVTQ